MERAHTKWIVAIEASEELEQEEKRRAHLIAGDKLAFDVASVLDGVKVYD